MSVATLTEVLSQARKDKIAIAGLVVLGWEDIGAFVAAAEASQTPIILQAGPGCRKNTPLSLLGPMFRYHAERAHVPVVCHLDHGYELEEVKQAIDAGFSSVMIDGSQKSLQENIALTKQTVALARAAHISVEGEIGYVGYDRGKKSRGTDPQEAAALVAETGLDALAISAGNTHLQTQSKADIDVALIEKIAALVDVPLVLHGGSGIKPEMRSHLARTGLVQKFNVGTEIRQVFGQSVRGYLADNESAFDRLGILQSAIAPMTEASRKVIDNLAGRS